MPYIGQHVRWSPSFLVGYTLRLLLTSQQPLMGIARDNRRASIGSAQQVNFVCVGRFHWIKDSFGTSETLRSQSHASTGIFLSERGGQ